MASVFARSYVFRARNGRRYSGKLLELGPKWLPLQRKATRAWSEMVAATAESYLGLVRSGRRYSGKLLGPGPKWSPL